MQDITAKQYLSLQEAFKFFNDKLFNNGLPECLITFQRKKGCGGYFSPKRFESRLDNTIQISEIALNVALFTGKTDKYILSILVHEMVHHWQDVFGKPGRGNYHNEEWATKMFEIGLMASSTGKEFGKQTGQSMSHYILTGDKFDVCCDELLARGACLDYNSRENPKNPKKNKTKYQCPCCETNVWGKPELNLLCVDCDVHYLPY